MSATRFELPRWECLELLKAETVGRMCVVEHDHPVAFPINYRVLHTHVDEADEQIRIIVRTAADTSVARYEGPASFEVDQIADDRRSAWSVIVRGGLRRVVGQHELPDTYPLLSDGRNQWMVLNVTSISGRRFTSHAPVDDFSVEWQTANR